MPKKEYSFLKYLMIALIILTIIILGLIKFRNILPGEYFLILAILLILILGFLIFLLTNKSLSKKIVGEILSLIYMAFLILEIIYEITLTF